MRRIGIILVIFLAIAFAAIAGGLTYIYLKGETGQKGLNLKSVVVSARDLTFGENLKLEDMKVAMYPGESVPKGAYSVPDSLLGQVTKVFLMENEPILESKLSSKGGGLSLLISKNMRASSIQVDKVSGVSGFILPGDRVDVILTVNRYNNRGNYETVAKTILQNIEVLAAGEKTEQKENKVITVQSVTLLVDPQGVQSLALAANEGKLNLALRNPTDEDTTTVASVTTEGILNEGSVQKSEPKVVVKVKEVPQAPAKPDSMTMIKGGQMKKEAPAMPEEKKEGKK